MWSWIRYLLGVLLYYASGRMDRAARNIVKQLMEDVGETAELRRRGREHVINVCVPDKATQRLEERLSAVIQRFKGGRHVKCYH
jgi:hypothetical protein